MTEARTMVLRFLARRRRRMRMRRAVFTGLWAFVLAGAGATIALTVSGGRVGIVAAGLTPFVVGMAAGLGSLAVPIGWDGVAGRIDRRYGLADRLTTVLELDDRGRDDAPADCVYRQAAVAVDNLPTRLTVGPVLGRALAAAASVTIILVAAAGAMTYRRNSSPVVEAVAGMTPSQRGELADELRDASDESPAAVDLRELAEIIEVRDRDRLGQLLDRLSERGMTLQRLLPAGFHSRLGLDPPKPEPGLAGSSENAYPDQPPAVISVAGTSEKNPRTPSEPPADPSGRETFTPWSAARARAAEPRAVVPARYRTMIRTYYQGHQDTDEPGGTSRSVVRTTTSD